jgi:hypothetical protein
MKEIMKSELMNEILISNESLLNKDDDDDMDEKRQAQSLNVFGNIKKAE